MNTFSNHIATRPVQTVFKLACIAAILAGCGGGGTGGTSTTSTFASGPIQGLGSIIVNGVRFDDSSASVASDDDDNNEVHKSGDLKVGMVVTVQGDAITTDDSGARRSKASEVHFGSELVGPAQSISRNAGGLTGTFSVLGQLVTVDKSTTFDDSLSGGVAGLAGGTVVEVHGLFDSAKTTYTATRVEAKSSAGEFKIRGTVSALNKDAKTFKIGDKTISYDPATAPSTLADGQIVRVKVQKTPDANGNLVAIRIKSGERKVEDHDEAEIKGAVSNIGTNGTTFDVNGQAVDASKVTNLPTLKAGDFVEVEGSLSNRILNAKKVSLEDGNAPGAGEFEFHRKIVSANATAKTFVLDTTTISWDDTTTFQKGATAASLTKDTCVEVKAVTKSGSTELSARTIKLDNSCTQ